MVLDAEALYARLARQPLEAAGQDGYAARFSALGTHNEIVVRAPTRERAERFREAALRWVARFEARYSRFLPTSLISRINAAAGEAWVDVDAEAEDLFALCDRLYAQTRGICDPAAGALHELWDFRRAHDRLPTPDEVERARARSGWTRVQRRPGGVFLPERGMQLDLGGIGKEYAVDRVFEMALGLGLTDLMVDFGHDVRVAGAAPPGGPWRIGLEDPRHPGRCWGGVALTGGALCCSGDYARYFEHDGVRYGHLVDPRLGKPPDHGVRAVWVVAPTCTEAGVLAKAAFLVGLDEGLSLIDGAYGAAGAVWTDREVWETRRFGDYALRQESLAV